MFNCTEGQDPGTRHQAGLVSMADVLHKQGPVGTSILSHGICKGSPLTSMARMDLQSQNIFEPSMIFSF